MSYLALVTSRFEEAAEFYGSSLGFPVLEQWDREHGRGRRFDIGGGVRLELLDNAREHSPLKVHEPGERFQLVVEVDDIHAARTRLRISTPEPSHVSWGAILFQLRDPDGIPVTFLQWDKHEGAEV